MDSRDGKERRAANPSASCRRKRKNIRTDTEGI